MGWPHEAELTAAGHRQLVRVLVAQAEGSAPREAGAAMLVWADGTSGTIGGGALEFSAISAARSMLGRGDWHRELHSYPLGPALGQCCGGMVRLLFETAPPSYPWTGGDETKTVAGLIIRPIGSGSVPVVVRDRTIAPDWPLPVLRAMRQMLSGERPRETLLIAGGKHRPAYVIEPEAAARRPLYLYGAGHVGRAVVRALEGLPFAITWIDVAAERFPSRISPNAVPHICSEPAAFGAAAPPDALHLVMTFSHPLDFAITAAILSRPFSWAGLIGSVTKRVRFEKRLREAGLSNLAITQLNCPIGIAGIKGKEPAMIAVSVAAQLAAWVSAIATDGECKSARG